MDTWLWTYANPHRFQRLVDMVVPICLPVAIAVLAVGLAWGFFWTPDDYRQGASIKIIFLHVPSAMMAINCWICMLVASLIWLVRRHVVSSLVARAVAPIGVIMTVIAIVTGALWGKPIWGTYWAWDPRLTSFSILFFFYLGYIGLWSALEEHEIAANLTSILALVGSVFALASRYAVNFWAQGLHQGASLSVDSKEHISNVFYHPLLVSILGFVLLFIALLLLRTRTELQVLQLKLRQIREGYRA